MGTSSAPSGGPWDTGVVPPNWSPPTCAHGIGWPNPCAACYPSPYPVSVVSQTVDLTPLIERLDRIERLLAGLGSDEGGAKSDG